MSIIDSYLNLSRNYFASKDKHVEFLYYIANDIFNLGVDIKVIHSNSARHEVINDQGKNVIIWDMNYWKLFEQYYLLALALDDLVENQSDLNRCVDLISSVFLYFLANKFENNADVSLSFAKECLKAGYKHIPSVDEDHPNFKKIDYVLFISKVYIFHHELTHLLYNREQALFNKDIKEVKNSLKFIKENMLEDDFFKYYQEFTRDETLLIINDMIDGKYDGIAEEMCADTRSMVETLELVNMMNNQKVPLEEFIPFSRSCISTVRIFDTFLNSLIKEVEYLAPLLQSYKYHSDDFISDVKSKRNTGNKKALLRVGMSYLLEDVQMLLKYKTFGHFHDRHPLSDNYEKYIVPRFNEFTEIYIPYIICDAYLSRDIEISFENKILIKDFLLM